MHLTRLEPIELADFWPSISGYLQGVVARSGGRLTLRSVLDAALAGAFQLWAAVDDEGEVKATAVTRVLDWPSGMASLEVIGVGGADMDQWLRLETDLAEFAKSQGCGVIEQEGRDGWQRKLKERGWEKVFVRMEKKL